MPVIYTVISWLCSFFNAAQTPNCEDVTLTGEDSEWVDVSQYVNELPGRLFQNKRCSSVFRHRSGYAYDVNRYTFVKEGIEYNSAHSSFAVEFPYTPRRTVIQFESFEYLVFRLYAFFNVEYKG